MTTGGGTTATGKVDRFKFAPTVTGLAPAEGPVTGGTRVTIIGTGFATAPGAIRFKFEKSKGARSRMLLVNGLYRPRPGAWVGSVDVKATVNKVSSPKSPGDLYAYH